MGSYDEDLMSNRFYISMSERCPELYSTAANNRWTVCIPCSGALTGMKFTENDFQNHVLVPVESEENDYNTVHGKRVSVRNSTIITSTGFEEQRRVPILFEETFFNSQHQSYRVVCLATLLEGGNPIADTSAHSGHSLTTLTECEKLLFWREDFNNDKTRRKVDTLIGQFNRSMDHFVNESLNDYGKAAHDMYVAALNAILKERHVHGELLDEAQADKIKVAVETYVLHGVYRKLFKGISSCLATTDAKVNKITRNLASIQVKDLNIRPEISDSIPRARRELSALVNSSTPMEKLICIRKTMLALMHSATDAGLSRRESRQEAVTTDDLLPVLVFMIIKCNIAHWSSQLTYMKLFRFSKPKDDEFGYYLASFEAALEYIRNGHLEWKHSAYFLCSDDPTAKQMLTISTEENGFDDTNILKEFFSLTSNGDAEGAQRVLDQSRAEYGHVVAKLCHPLCSCDKCEKFTTKSGDAEGPVTVFSRDDRGCTALHIAASHGQTEVLEYLIKLGGSVSTTSHNGSTPLHSACERGFQNVTLLLLHYQADPNMANSDGNTALHLCALNGHDDCVKALLFQTRAENRVDVNYANDVGDTALHIAARWGYANIVRVLLENGASIEVRNRRNETPVNCAHSPRTAKLLMSSRATEMVEMPTPSEASRAARMTRDHSPAFSNPTRRASTSNRRGSDVTRFMRPIVEGDINLVRYFLDSLSGTNSDSEDDERIVKRELCHPLCQCPKCVPLQKMSLNAAKMRGFGINSPNDEGFACLHLAAMHGQSEIASLLIRKGANIELGTKTVNATPLHIACKYNKPAVVELLISLGADTDCRDSSGHTPLHYCSMNGAIKSAQVLLKNVFDLNLANHKGDTALHESARWNTVEMARLLLAQGAKSDVKNHQHMTAVELAVTEEMTRAFQSLVRENSVEAPVETNWVVES